MADIKIEFLITLLGIVFIGGGLLLTLISVWIFNSEKHEPLPSTPKSEKVVKNYYTPKSLKVDPEEYLCSQILDLPHDRKLDVD